ncbi:hypothetical protein [Flavobacterium sp. 123]|jgi:hypothetical protein|uniref:hypothetical protein n=1 Tax=Flavobacterium sp. 123 TaxID=2135627 RepID=UPI000EAFE389|nr:hypothetical protein [Flavobacterium sp. 123]RKT00466.1 hypothetical protein C8C88_2293 [Flavobacterium sp. 123]
MEVLNKMKKGLVYDNQKYFSRFLKYEFEQEFDFNVCRNFDYFDQKLNDYSVIIFVIYSEDEIFDFISVYKKGIPVIVCSFNKIILEKLKKMEDISVLDTSSLRSELIIELRNFFNFSIPQYVQK